MKTLFAAIVLCAFTATASAQEHDFYPQDTEAMWQNARKHMNLVDASARLTEAQKEKVLEVYMRAERELVAIDHRYSMSGHTPEEDAKERALVVANMDVIANRELKAILTGEQMLAWEEASK